MLVPQVVPVNGDFTHVLMKKNECVNDYVAFYESKILRQNLGYVYRNQIIYPVAVFLSFSIPILHEFQINMSRWTNKSAVLNLGYRETHLHVNYSRIFANRAQFLSIFQSSLGYYNVYTKQRTICLHQYSIFVIQNICVKVVGTQMR